MISPTKTTNWYSNQSWNKVDSPSLESGFQDLFAGADNGFVSKFHWIRFTRIRKVSKYGLWKLIHFYENPDSANSKGDGVWCALGKGTSIVVPMKGTYKLAI